MNILVLGAGEIGFYLAQRLIEQNHNLCIIERDDAVAALANEKLDARIVHGNGASVSILEEAGVAECDVLLGLSSDDNTNLVAASVAKSLGAKKTIARVHSAIQQDQWLFDFRSHFNLDYLFSSERLAAVELAKYIRNPDALIVEELARGRIELQQLEVTPGSPALGKSLPALGLPPRIRIGSIHRGNQAIIPQAGEVLHAGDVITLFGNAQKLQEVTPLFRKARSESEETRVVIFGGGEYGFALAQMLEGGRFRTRIFEEDPDRCDQLSKMLQHTTLINADATSLQMLREEQVGDADFFVGATRNDEDNVMTCLQAKDLGVRHCLTLVHRADYADAVMRAGDKLGILGAVSPRVATSRDLMRWVSDEAFTPIARLSGEIEILEFTITGDSALAGQPVASVKWPAGSGLVSLTHGSSASVPAADDVLHPGDTVAALVTPASRKAFLRLIS